MAKGDLTDEQWQIVEGILPRDRVRADGRGRPWSDRRTVLNGVLWILRTGAPWQDLPPRYGPYQTVHRRFQNWVRVDAMEKVLLAVAHHLQEAGGLDLKECFVDGTFASAKKGGSKWARPNAGKERSLWYWLMARVLRSDFTWTRRPRRK